MSLKGDNTAMLILPDWYARRVTVIPVTLSGIKVYVLDLDNTLLRPGHNHVASDIALWVQSVKQENFVIILTNTVTEGFTQKAGRVGRELAVPVVACRSKAERKPSLWGPGKVKEITGCSYNEMVLIGDQSSDVECAAGAGMKSIMVDSIGHHFWWNYLSIGKRAKDLQIRHHARFIDRFGPMGQ
jgi:predicted HAD superfamily phosphohydrolase YqeG